MNLILNSQFAIHYFHPPRPSAPSAVKPISERFNRGGRRGSQRKIRRFQFAIHNSLLTIPRRLTVRTRHAPDRVGRSCPRRGRAGAKNRRSAEISYRRAIPDPGAPIKERSEIRGGASLCHRRGQKVAFCSGVACAMVHTASMEGLGKTQWGDRGIARDWKSTHRREATSGAGCRNRLRCASDFARLHEPLTNLEVARRFSAMHFSRRENARRKRLRLIGTRRVCAATS